MKLLLFLIPILCFGENFSISPKVSRQIGQKIWKNECKGTLEGLTHWGVGENFPSLGIGHFIWFPIGIKERFEETFPSLLKFLEQEGTVLPEWLKKAQGCPWSTREEFYEKIQSPKVKELREFLYQTRELQAVFMARRLENTLPLLLEKLPPEKQKSVKALFYRLAADPKGLYAMVDYLNFKGAGLFSTEQYQGQGWGLLQVLQSIPASSTDPLSDFVESAKRVLHERVKHSPPERNEQRWLNGWMNRLNTYLE
jgi:hypothetical protein